MIRLVIRLVLADLEADGEICRTGELRNGRARFCKEAFLGSET
jgi:hypothetical protein